MMIDELNAKYSLEGSGVEWTISDSGQPSLWVRTARHGYEFARIDQRGMYVGPSGLVPAADIAKLAQATAEFRHALALADILKPTKRAREEADRLGIDLSTAGIAAATTVRIPTGTLNYDDDHCRRVVEALPAWLAAAPVPDHGHVDVQVKLSPEDEAAIRRHQTTLSAGYDLANIESEDDDAAMWAVTRDGAESATIVCGYNDGGRGRIAMHFASDDDAGWANENYDEFLCVRRCNPDPERDGVIVRVRVEAKP